MKLDGESERDNVERVGNRCIVLEPGDMIWDCHGHVTFESFEVIRKDGKVVGIRWFADNISAYHAIESRGHFNCTGASDKVIRK